MSKPYTHNTPTPTPDTLRACHAENDERAPLLSRLQIISSRRIAATPLDDELLVANGGAP